MASGFQTLEYTSHCYVCRIHGVWISRCKFHRIPQCGFHNVASKDSTVWIQTLRSLSKLKWENFVIQSSNAPECVEKFMESRTFIGSSSWLISNWKFQCWKLNQRFVSFCSFLFEHFLFEIQFSVDHIQCLNFDKVTHSYTVKVGRSYSGEVIRKMIRTKLLCQSCSGKVILSKLLKQTFRSCTVDCRN